MDPAWGLLLGHQDSTLPPTFVQLTWLLGASGLLAKGQLTMDLQN